MMVTPNEYLDARLPAWIDYELEGYVKYDRTCRLVQITAGPVTAPLIERLRAMEVKL